MYVEEVVLFVWVTAIVFYIRDVIVVNVDQAFALVDFVASEYFNLNPFLELWRNSDFIVGRFLLSFSLEISFSLFYLIVSVSLPFSWVRQH